MLIFGPGEKAPTDAQIYEALLIRFDGVPSNSAGKPFDRTQLMLLTTPTWSNRLDQPTVAQITELSQLFEEGTREEKYYWAGVSENPYLNEDLVLCFPTHIIAHPETYDMDLSDQLWEIVDRLAFGASNYSGGKAIQDELIQDFKLTFGDFLAALEGGRP